jgi:hypothetical protein
MASIILRPWPLAYIVDKVLPAGVRHAERTGLSLWGHDLGAWSIPAIVALVCALMVGFHTLAGGIGYFVNVMTMRVGLHG